MNKFIKSFGTISKNIFFGIKTSFLASKKYFALKCIVLLTTAFLPLINIWLWKEILNGIVNPTGVRKTIILYLFIYLSIGLLSNLIAQFDIYINGCYSYELQFYIEKVMIEKTSRMDLSFFDSATMGDKVRRARSNFDIMNGITWQVFDIISKVINIITSFVIVCAYNVWISLMTVILLIPYMIYNKKHTQKLLRMEKEQIRDNRKMEYYGGVFFDNNIQFEIKLNNIGNYFISKYKSFWEKLYKINKDEDARYNVRNTFISILNILSQLIVLLISIIDVIHHNIGIGDLQYNTSMVSRFRDQINGLMMNVNQFLVNNVRLNELREFIDIKPEIEKSGILQPALNPRIEFSHVSFRYPNSEQYVLKDCSFIIEPYEKVGLIGLNGAGKTTIIKLMFRFYDPEAGCILVDGIDLKEYNIYAVRKIFGVLFQDYVTYCLPLREIIALSDFDERFNDEKLKYASDISGVTDIIKDWEQGYDSILGRYYADNGKDLSGGQWQLVGLARAYFKDSNFMILDEPSAALDPISEDRIFKQLYDLSKGKSSVIISHRLSNTTFADKILVIDDGHIIEQGSHFELIKQHGIYAHLFNLQASKYI